MCPQKKFRIVCEEVGLIPHTVKTCIKGNLLHVIGLVRSLVESGVYAQREFKRSYELPRFACVDQLVTLFNEHGQLIIELPLVDAYPECGNFGGLVLPTRETVLPDNVYGSVGIVGEEDRLYKPIHMGVQPTYFRYNRSIPESLGSRLLDDRHVIIDTPLSLGGTNVVNYRQLRNWGF